MAFSERLQFILTANADQAIRAFERTGKAADAQLGRAEERLDRLGSRMTKFGAGAMAAAGVAGAALWRIGKGASDLNESINAVNVSFGAAADGVLRLGENAARSVGLSKREFNGLAVQFAAFSKQIAGDGGDVVATIDEITGRAADFASVMNLDVAEAARLFRSGLAGETEPLRRFGIDLSAAAVKAHAFAAGIAESGRELTEQQKIQARWSLLMQQTSQMQGDFANTSGELANSHRILRAELQNLSDDIGAGLLPVMKSAVATVRAGVDAFGSLPGPVKSTAGTIAGVGTVALGAAGALSFLIGQTIKARENFAALGKHVGAVAPALGAVSVAAVGFGLHAKQAADRARNMADAFREVSDASDEGALRAWFDALANGLMIGKDAAAVTRELAEANLEGALRLRDLVREKVRLGQANEAEINQLLLLDRAVANEVQRRKEQTATTERYRAVLDATLDPTDELAEGTDDLADAHERAAKRAEDQRKAIQDLRSEMLAQIDKQYAATKAVDDAAEAQQRYASVAADAKSTERDRTKALRDAREAMVEMVRKQIEANGITLDSAVGVDQQIRKLGELAGTLAPGSPLRKELEAYISALKRIPQQIETQAKLRVTGTVLSKDGDVIGVRQGGPRAAGGPVMAGTVHQVAESAPEVFRDSAGRSYLLPGRGGGEVSPLADSRPSVTINVAGAKVSAREIADELTWAWRTR